MSEHRCDVVVVGAGLAGLLTADRLRRAGADVVLVGDGPSATERSLGIVALGWLDSPARLAAGLGDETARGLLAWSSLAVASLTRTVAELAVPARFDGSWRVALDEGEAAEWRRSVELLRGWGLADARLATPEERAGIVGGAVEAAWIPGDGRVDLAALCLALEARFLAAGGRRVSGAAVLDGWEGAPYAQVGEGRIQAELAVVAAGAGSPSVHPYFTKTTYPLRLQSQRVNGVSGGGSGDVVLARHRFEAWCGDGEDLGFVGCRWAEQPEMGAGITDAETVSAVVATKQDAFLAKRLGISTDAERTRRVGIVTCTCDGLPLVGPLPGAPKVIGLVGWSGWGLSLLPRAVDEVCAAMLGEDAPGGVSTPGWLSARRMV